MRHPHREAVSVIIVAALLALVPGSAEATVMAWRPPAVKEVKAAPSKAAPVGKPVNIECVVGTAGEVKLDTNSPQGKYLAMERSPSWTVPVEIRVNGKTIGKFDDAGLASNSSTWNHSAAWIPAAADAGKAAVIECAADPVKKIFFSAKTISIPVIGKEIPRLLMKDQPPPAMKAVPQVVPPPGTGSPPPARGR